MNQNGNEITAEEVHSLNSMLAHFDKYTVEKWGDFEVRVLAKKGTGITFLAVTYMQERGYKYRIATLDQQSGRVYATFEKECQCVGDNRYYCGVHQD